MLRGPLFPLNSLMLHGIIYAQSCQEPEHRSRTTISRTRYATISETARSCRRCTLRRHCCRTATGILWPRRQPGRARTPTCWSIRTGSAAIPDSWRSTAGPLGLRARRFSCCETRPTSRSPSNSTLRRRSNCPRTQPACTNCIVRGKKISGQQSLRVAAGQPHTIRAQAVRSIGTRRHTGEVELRRLPKQCQIPVSGVATNRSELEGSRPSEAVHNSPRRPGLFPKREAVPNLLQSSVAKLPNTTNIELTFQTNSYFRLETRKGVNMKAYVVITAKAGTARDIASAMAALPGVIMADACWGTGDVYAVVNFSTWPDLNGLVMDKIHSMNGILRTETHVAVEP